MNNTNIIFLAHVSENKPFMLNLFKSLKRKGFNPFIDIESLGGGVIWEYNLEETISISRIILIGISSNSIKKESFFQKEIRLSLSESEKRPPNQQFIIPILLDDIEMPNFYQIGTINLKDFQAIRIYGKYKKAGTKRLFDLIQSLICLERKYDKQKETNLDDIRTLIFKNKIEDAINELRIIIEIDELDNLNSIVIISGRFNKLQVQIIEGTLTQDEVGLELRKIVSSLLKLMTQIENNRSNS